MTTTKKPVRTKPRSRGTATRNHGALRDLTAVAKADPKRQAKYDALKRQMDTASLGENVGFDHYWEAVGEILDGDLWAARGFESADVWLKSVVKVARRTANRLVRVARYATPQDETNYGVAILDAALGFIEAKTGGPAKGGKLPVKFDELRIPAVRDGATRKLALGEATLVDIRKATTALTSAGGNSRAHVSPLEQLLAHSIAKNKALSGVTVHVSDGHVRFGAVPVSAIDEFAKLLRELRVPAGPGVK